MNMASQRRASIQKTYGSVRIKVFQSGLPIFSNFNFEKSLSFFFEPQKTGGTKPKTVLPDMRLTADETRLVFRELANPLTWAELS